MSAEECGLVFVKNTYGSVNEIRDVKRSDFVSDIIARSCGDSESADVELLQGSRILPQNLTLLDAGIALGSTLTLIERQIQVNIRSEAGMIRSIPIFRSSSLGYLKQRILDKEEIDIKNLGLKVQNRIILPDQVDENSKSLSEMGVRDGMTIDILEKVQNGSEPQAKRPREDIITIIIIHPNESTLELPVKRTETIRHIITRCCDHAHEDDCNLIYDHQTLPRDVTLAEIGAVQGSRFKLVDDLVQIFVKNLLGKSVTYNVRLSSSVDCIKTLIWNKEGLPSNQQRLNYSGKQLENRKSLKYYGIRKESTLHLALRLGGGYE